MTAHSRGGSAEVIAAPDKHEVTVATTSSVDAKPPVASRKRVWREVYAWIARRAVSLWLPVFFLGGWFIVSRGSTDLFYPPLSEILTSLREQFFSSLVTENLLPSLKNLVFGLGIALILGLTVGYALGLSEGAKEVFGPILDLFRTTPVIALIPLFIALFGIGMKSQVLIIAWAASWPILLSTMDGVAAVDTGYKDAAAVLRMSKFQETFLVRLPAAGPRIMAGVTTAVSIAITGMVAIEFYSSTNGVGRFLAHAQTTFDIPGLYAGAIAAGIVGYSVALLVRLFERRVALKWHYEMRSRGTK